ncbi:MAG: phosphopantetheine-binding protein [Pseudohongiellaceae bacterium]
MNKDVQDNVLSNILNLLSDYSDNALVDDESISDSSLSELVDDSLSVLEIIYELEDKFQVTIAAERLESLRTVGDLATAVNHELKVCQQ